MPGKNQTVVLDKLISELMARRNDHAQELARIDALFAKYGIQSNGSARHGAPQKVVASASTKRRKSRRSFGQTAEELVLSLLSSGKQLTTSQINAAWSKSGRGGSADNTLGKLVKEKKLKRTPVKDGRGSSYAAS